MNIKLICVLLTTLLLCSGCIVSKEWVPPIKTPAMLIQTVYGTIEYSCCVKGKWKKPITKYEFKYYRIGFVIFDPKLYDELHPGPYYVVVPDYNRELMWHIPRCSYCEVVE